jgi:glycerol-3-phosphate acyltransferase PlsY
VQSSAAGVALVVSSFLIGAIPWGYIAGRIRGGVDLRTVGSGSTGATNVLRTVGVGASAAVFVLDFLKGFGPVFIAKSAGFDPGWQAAAAVAAVAGHCWSPFIQFKGGKGVATGAGALVALFPPVILVASVTLVVIWLTRVVSLGSLLAAFLATALTITAAGAGRVDWSVAVATIAIAAIVTIRHGENIRRLRQGTERRLGERARV